MTPHACTTWYVQLAYVYIFIAPDVGTWSKLLTTIGWARSQSCIEGCTSLTSKTIYFDIDQYRCTVSDLPLFFIFIKKIYFFLYFIFIYIYIYMFVCVYYNKYKSLP